MNLAVEELKKKFPDVIREVKKGDCLTLICGREGFLEFIEYLKEQKGFIYLIDLCGVDYLNYPGKNWDERFEVVYHLYNFEAKELLRIRVRVPEEDCWHYSVVKLWKTADWFERECYDMFGIVFKGHPDLRRVLMPDDWKGYPLRKDYPLELSEEEEWEVYKELVKKNKPKR